MTPSRGTRWPRYQRSLERPVLSHLATLRRGRSLRMVMPPVERSAGNCNHLPVEALRFEALGGDRFRARPETASGLHVVDERFDRYRQALDALGRNQQPAD